MTDQFEVGYALLIGVNENAVPQLALPDVAKDIAALQSILVHPERCAYPEANVKVITGSEATRQAIQDGLDWLYDKLQADDSGNTTAVIYYSGHGWQDTGSSPPTYYLIPYDMQTGRYRSRALRATDFADTIGELRPRRLLVILDCCHAAGVEAKDLDAAANAYQETAIPPHVLMAGEKAVANAKDISELAQGAGRAVLSSSQGTQKSYIRRDRKMSIFTYHLLEALTGHAQPQEGAKEVLVSDVMSYITRTVPPSAHREANAEQTPDFQVSGNFPVALLLGGKGLSKGEPAPDPIGDAPGAPGTGSIHQPGQTVHGPQTNITGDVQGNVYSGNIEQIGDRTVNTGGGAYIGGNVTAREFVGRDKVTYGDEVRGDKITTGDISGTGIAVGRDAKSTINKGFEGGTFHVNQLVVQQGGVSYSGSKSEQPTARNNLTEEPVRLDVAYPPKALVKQVFDIAVSVRQPDSEPLQVTDLTEYTSGEGTVFRSTDDETVVYRIEVTGSNCTVTPSSVKLRLRPRKDSPPRYFQVLPLEPGSCRLLIHAYQEDEILAAQTRVQITIEIPTQSDETVFAILFNSLYQAVQQSTGSDRQRAIQTVQALKEEVARGDDADDVRIARQLDTLVDLVPDAGPLVVAAFGTPLLSGIAGPVTGFVLERLRGRQ